MNLQEEASPALQRYTHATQESNTAEAGPLQILRQRSLRELLVFLLFSVLIFNLASLCSAPSWHSWHEAAHRTKFHFLYAGLLHGDTLAGLHWTDAGRGPFS